jgi:type I restriction enzyme S subunit
MSRADIEKYRLQHGDLLVCEGGEVGRCAIWESPLEECYYQKALHRLRPLRGFDPRVMAAFLRQWSDVGFLANYVTQTSIAHLPREKLMDVPLAVPPPAEQRAIAEALSDVDALLDGLDRLIAKKRDIKQAAMRQLLTGQIRLPGFQGEWEVKRLGELGSTYGGLTGKNKADFGSGSAKYVTFMNVMTNIVVDHSMFDSVRVSPSENQNLVKRGDLLLNGSSETPEEVALCSIVATEEKNLFLNSFCFGFRPNSDAGVDGLLLAAYIRSTEGREIMKSLAQGSTRYNLSKRAFLEAAIRLPSLSEQSAIAGVLADMDAEITALEARRDKARALKQGMMQELLTGRTRLV